MATIYRFRFFKPVSIFARRLGIRGQNMIHFDPADGIYETTDRRIAEAIRKIKKYNYTELDPIKEKEEIPVVETQIEKEEEKPKKKKGKK